MFFFFSFYLWSFGVLFIFGVSLLKQGVMKLLLITEYLYMNVLLFLLSVGSGLILFVMVFSACEGVLGLTLFMVWEKFFSGSVLKFVKWF
uniref:NADH dehydrogenase subunit 4L n=1 Tax=Rhodosoma turcicum TaxID=1256665 RepID=S0DGV3_9ASCI|nr:NADH dehydrogenase subunit 4L [Rhodosoma turcicum]CCO25798.1 NADH dehydrogenase subunit 4L [Rhodosoma turcicum]